jgi:hypothetical protein
MTDLDEKPMKALYDHCVTVFEEMFKEAEPEERAINNYDGGPTMDQPQTVTEITGYMIWTGHLTQLFARLGMSTPLYTGVMQTLKKMGCAEQLKRGGGNAKSVWRLVRKPEEEVFNAAEKLKRPTDGSFAALQQQFRDMNKRLSDVEERVDALLASAKADV